MLDELLGRAALKARIEELEAEVRHLERELDAERERRREAVTDRQAADERVNRLEDRIADLEGQLARVEPDGEAALSYRGTESLRGDRLASIVSRLESVDAGPEGALTAMVDGGEGLPDAVREAFGDRASLVSRAAPCLALTDDAGLVSVALDPPLPPEPFASWDDRFRLDRGWFLPAGSYALALVRSDVFAYGEYEGPDRIDFEGFESDVRSDHGKGGFSQSRFERRRDEQIDAHLDRVASVLGDRDPARLIVTGEGTLLGRFEDDAVRTVPVDATGDPTEALEAAHRAVFTTTVYRI